MATFISILRGINVGGHNQIKMDALQQMYISLGFSDTLTYIQSGNIIFHTGFTNTLFLEKTIAGKILETFGCNVPVLVLTPEEIKTALDNNPFLKDTAKNPAFMHLTFLSGQPDTTLLKKIQTGNYLPDEFIISGKTIYLYCPNGYGRTKLTNSFFENKLKLTATTRNYKTVTELLVLAQKM